MSNNEYITQLREANEEFFVIKVTNAIGRSGYLIQDDEGIKFAMEALVADVKQFPTQDAAGAFVVDHDIYKLGKITVVSSLDLMKTNIAKIATQDYYGIVNEKGHWLHYDPNSRSYFFESSGRKAGCVGWPNISDIENNLPILQQQFHWHTITGKKI